MIIQAPNNPNPYSSLSTEKAQGLFGGAGAKGVANVIGIEAAISCIRPALGRMLALGCVVDEYYLRRTPCL